MFPGELRRYEKSAILLITDETELDHRIGEGSVMGKLTEDAATFFAMAQRSLVHAALKAPGAGDWFVLLNGLGQIATGLEILSGELKATRKEIGEAKDLLLQLQRRKP